MVPVWFHGNEDVCIFGLILPMNQVIMEIEYMTFTLTRASCAILYRLVEVERLSVKHTQTNTKPDLGCSTLGTKT